MPKQAVKKGVAPAEEKAVILVNIYDGERRLLPEKTNVLLRVIDGEQRPVFADFVKGPTIRITVPFQNGMRDVYTVLVSADGYLQAGFHPVRVSPSVLRPVFLMLLPKKAELNFSQALWATLRNTHPALTSLFMADAAGETQAQTRYEALIENRPAAAACLWNTLTVMKDVDLPDLTPVDYLKQLIWDESMAQDRFFAWADAALLQQVQVAAMQDAFSQEPSPGLLHPGATKSFKQVQFGEANLQVTFHEGQKPPGGKKNWVKVELDIDYFKDPAAHFLLEVVPGFVSLTDPKRVYVLRWIAGRQANVPAFEPPYTIRRA
jgi:hypothetical protein